MFVEQLIHECTRKQCQTIIAQLSLKTNQVNTIIADKLMVFQLPLKIVLSLFVFGGMNQLSN